MPIPVAGRGQGLRLMTVAPSNPLNPNGAGELWLDPSLAGVFAASFQGLILTDAGGYCWAFNSVALEILGLETCNLDLSGEPVLISQFLVLDLAWEAWQQHLSTSPPNSKGPDVYRHTTTILRTNGQTAVIPYCITPQAQGFLWILPPPQLIQWSNSGPPAKLTEATYQAILETQTEMVVRFLPDSTFTYVNPAYCQMIGRRAEDLLGRHFFEVIPPDTQAMMREELQAMNTLTPKHPFRIVINPSIGHDGSQIWHEWTNQALFNESGEIIEFQATGRDITADYNFTRALKAAKERLQLAFDIAEMGYCDWDLRSNRVIWSDGYEQLMGLAPGTFDQRIETFISLVHPQDRERVQAVIDDIIQSHQQRTVEFRIVRPSGEIRWFLARGTAIYDDLGNPVRFTGVDMDITARKLREQELEYQRDLQQLLFEQSTDALFWVDSDTIQILDCNPRAVELFEAESKTELIGLVGHEDLHVNPLTPEEVADNIAQMHQKGYWTMEVEYKTRKGNRFWGNIACKPVELAGQAMTFVRITDVSRWKQIELELLNHERRYHTVFNQASLGIAFCEAPDYKLSDTNPFLQELLGYSGEELRTLEYRDFTHPDDIPREQALIEECLAGQRDHYQLEKRYIRKDGEIRWVNLFSTMVRAADGSIPYAFAFVKDITGRKNAEAQLQASEAKFGSMFTQAAVGIVYGSLSGEILSANQAFADIVGYTSDELLNMNFANLTYPPDLERESLLVDALMANEIPSYSIEKRYIRKDGSLLWVSLSVNKILDETGQAVGGIGIVQDINYRKALEQELEASHLKYQTLFEFLPIGLTLLDESGQVQESNPAAAEILGISTQAHLNLPHTAANWECYAPDGHRLTDQEFPSYRALHHWQTVQGEEIQVKKPDGSLAWISVTAVPLANIGVGAVIAYIDVTSRKHAELELQASEAKFRSIFEQAAFGISYADPEGNFLAVNPALCAITGYSPHELTHANFRDYFDPADLAQELDFIAAMDRGEIASYQMEKRIIRANGAVIWVEILINQLRDPHGHPIGYIGIIQDIDERKRLQAQLDAARQKFQALFENLPIGLNITDNTGQMIEINPASEAILGIPSREQIQQVYSSPIWECFYLDGRPLPVDELPASLALSQNQVVTNFEMWVNRPDGSRICLSVTAAPLPHPELGVAIAFFDITQIKQVEQELAAARLKYQTLFEVIPLGIFLTNEQGQIIEVNPASSDIVGISTEEHKKRRFNDEEWECYDCNGLPLAVENYPGTIALRENRAIRGVEVQYKSPSGKLIWLDVTAAPIPIPGLGIVLTYQDITERKHIEQTLRDQETTLRLALEAGNQGVWVLDLINRTGRVDSGYAKMLGYEVSEIGTTFQAWETSLHPEDQQTIPALLYAYIAGERDEYHVEFRIRTKSGDYKWVLSTGKIVAWDQSGQPTRMIGTHIDIHKRKLAELALQKQVQEECLLTIISQDIRRSLNLEQILGSAVNNIRELLQADRVLILRLLPQNRAQTVAESITPGLESLNHCCWLNVELPGFCIAEYLTNEYQFVDHLHDCCDRRCWIPGLAEAEMNANIMAPIHQTHLTETTLWGILLVQSRTTLFPWTEADGHLTAKICQQLTIAIQQAELYESLQAANAELQAANQELAYLARYDGLTQVANRRYFDEHLQQEWQRMEREHKPLGLIMCDIDFFKAYNDHYGHIAGDTCLRETAQALKHILHRAGDLVARYGGEEFALIMPNTDLAGVIAVARKIQAAIDRLHIPHQYSPITPQITLSLGLTALIPHAQTQPETLIALADTSLYQAKQSGRNRYCWLSTSDATQSPQCCPEPQSGS